MTPEDEEIADEINELDLKPLELIAYAILKLARAQQDIAYQLKYLGNGDAATRMGAIEAYGVHVGEKMDRLADAIDGLRS